MAGFVAKPDHVLFTGIEDLPFESSDHLSSMEHGAEIMLKAEWLICMAM